MLKAKTIIKTCQYAPSQWEGKTEDGKSFYIRYRWGTLSLNVSKSVSNNVFDAINEDTGDVLFHKFIDDEFDNELNIDEVRKFLSEIIDLSAEEKLDKITF